MAGSEAWTAAGRRRGGEGRIGLKFKGSNRSVLTEEFSQYRIEEGGEEREFTRSWIVVEAPCIGEPPETFILALAAGEAVLDDVRTFGRSEMSGPEAAGGGFEGVVDGVGSCRAAGVSDSAIAPEPETGAL